MNKFYSRIRKIEMLEAPLVLVGCSILTLIIGCGGGSSSNDPINPPPVMATVDWQINVDTSTVRIPVKSALNGHYDLSGTLYDYGAVSGLKDSMSQVGFNLDGGEGSDWRMGLGRWEIGTELFDTLTDGSECPIILTGSESQFSTDLDLIASRDWFTFTDGMPVGLADINDSRYSLDYIRSSLDVANDFGASPFVSIDLMPRALAVNQTPNRTNCSASFTNSISNNQPVDPLVFASAVSGLVSRIVEGSGDKLGEQRPRKAQYWEVWNEPEFDLFWEPDLSTDPDTFFDMAVATLQQLADYRAASVVPEAQSLKFGLGSFANENTAITVIEGFDPVNIPLDFISFHQYNDDPLVVVDAIAAVKTTLENSVNYKNAELVLAEWGPDLDSRVADQQYAMSMDAALHASTVILLGAQVGLDRSHKALFYNYFPEIALGLIDNDGQPRPLYRAYEMMAKIIDSNKERFVLSNANSGRLDSGMGAVMVTRDQSSGTQRALFVNRNSTSRIARIAFDGVNTRPLELFVLDASDNPVNSLRSVAVTADEFNVPAESLVLVVF